jgi:hypothetical protein
MKRDFSFTLDVVPVAVIRSGSRATLVDRNGRTLRSNVAIARLGPADENVLSDYLWRRWAQYAIDRTRFDAEGDPWTRKALVLVKSFRLRRHGKPCRSSRRQGDRFKSGTWPEAADRMWMQAHNRYCRHRRTGWERWAWTVSGNQNKRAEDRYEPQNQHHGDAGAEHGSEPGLPVCTQRAVAHA